MDKKFAGRIVAGLLAGATMLTIIGFPHGATRNNAGEGEVQALQRTPNLVRTALQRTPDQFGTTEKQALQRDGVPDDRVVALNAWYDGASRNLTPAGPVAAKPSGDGTTDLSLSMAAEMPDKSLDTVAWADPIERSLNSAPLSVAIIRPGDLNSAPLSVAIIRPGDTNAIVHFPA